MDQLLQNGDDRHLDIYFHINDCPISWTSNRQTTVATSSSEAEYIGQFNAGKEALWLKKFLHEIGLQDVTNKIPTTIFGDNQAAITLSKDPVSHSKSKHMDIKFHWQREQVEKKRPHIRIRALK